VFWGLGGVSIAKKFFVKIVLLIIYKKNVIYVITIFVRIVKIILRNAIYAIMIFAKIVAQNAFAEIFFVILVLLNVKNVEEEFVIIAQQNVFAI
jgi:hypothetical protein